MHHFSRLLTASCLGLFLSSNAYSKASSVYYFQIGTYKNHANAKALLHKWQKKNGLNGRIHSFTTRQGKTLYEVQLGPYKNRADAHSYTHALQGFFVAYPAAPKKGELLLETANQAPQNEPLLRPLSPPNAGSPTTFFTSGLPYPSRSYVEGTLAERTQFFDADVMLPIMGTSDWIGYLDMAAKVGDDHAWYGSGGGGIRAVNGNVLLGGYLFADSNESTNHNNFWVINPGLELIGPAFDAHVNGYAPLSKEKSLGTFYGGERDLPSPFIVNRTLYDNLYELFDVTGPGFDGEVGYTINRPFRLRTFVGGYHFNMHDSETINGVQGGVEVPLTPRLTFLLHDAYDKVQRNTAMGTLRLSMGGLPSGTYNNVRDRMLDPLRRHLGAYQTGAGIPIVEQTKFIRTDALFNNIWFFSPGGSSFVLANGFANCTLENPCGTLSQNAIDGINTLAPNANFFFNPGTFNNPLPTTGFTLYNGQNFHGRMTHFLRPAQGNARALINDTLILPGKNTIRDLKIDGHTVVAGSQTGIVALNFASSITLDDLVVTSFADGGAISPVGVAAGNEAQLSIDNSVIAVSLANGNSGIQGILAGNSNVALNSTAIFVNARSVNPSSVEGLATVGGTFTISNSSINVFALNSGSYVAGINNSGTTFSLTNSSINVFADNSGNGSGVYGINNGNAAVNNLNRVAINVASRNLSTASPVVGIGNDTNQSITNYQNSSITADGTGLANVLATSATGTYNNLGSMVCTIIKDGVVSVVNCP